MDRKANAPTSTELRRTIQGATNKSESFNQFVQWVAFGGGRLLAENTRDEQRKMIKYHHLVANLLIFHTVITDNLRLRVGSHPAATDPYWVEALSVFGYCYV